MLKKVCDFRVEKVAKTLIFYTHTHTHVIIGEQSPVAILTESAYRAIRWIRFTLCSVLGQVCPKTEYFFNVNK